MRIAINTRLLIKNKMDGIGWFTYHVCKHMVRKNPQHDFIFIFDRPYHKDYLFGPNVIPHILRPPARHPFLWFYWFEIGIPSVIKKYNADVFFSPDGYIPLNSKVPVLNAIHDINFVHRPEDLPKLTSWYYNVFFPKYAHRATRIVTVSDYSKQDLSEYYHIPKEKVDVVYNGVSEDFRPLDKDEKEKVKKEWSKGKPYFFFVGTILPRKNIKNLMMGFDAFIESTGSDFHLLVAGYHKFGLKEIEQVRATLKNKDKIILTGRVDDNLLPKLMGAAEGLSYLPFYEGFGIPLVEAMKCGIPVLSSNTSCIPEITSGAAILKDPHSPADIALGFSELIHADKKAQLVKAGFEQSGKFTWESTAEAVWQSLLKII